MPDFFLICEIAFDFIKKLNISIISSETVFVLDKKK
jgi:hypothetical protein